jgi:hypothetical protein
MFGQVRAPTFPLLATSFVAVLALIGAAPASAAAARPSCQQQLTSLSVSASSVVAGGSLTGQVTLACKADRSGVSVGLTSDSPALTVPASVLVTYGSRTGSFTMTAGQAAAAVAVTVTASYGAVAIPAIVTVNPAATVRVASVGLSPSSVTAGGGVLASVTLTAAAPAGGAAVAVSTDSPIATAPATVTVPAGATSATFAVTTIADVSQVYTQTVAVRAEYAASVASAVLFVFPPPPPAGVAVRAVTLSASTVVGGSDPVSATVELTVAAPADTVVYLYGSAYGPVQMTPTVTIPAGQRTGSVQLRADQVASDYAYSLTAEVVGTTPAGASLLITPGPFAVSLSSTTIARGGSATGTIALNGGPIATDAVVTLSATVSGVSVPATVTIPAGATSATFRISAGTATGGTGRLAAVYSGVTKYVYFATY